MAAPEACRKIVVCALASSVMGCGGQLAGRAEPSDGGSVVPMDSGGPIPAKDASAGSGVVIGPIDFSKAPQELALDCTGSAGHLAFKNPCLVGLDMATASDVLGVHETECVLAGTDRPVWSFLLPLARIAQQPNMPLRFPGDLPSPPPGAYPIDLGGESFTSSILDEGTLEFKQIDPPKRAFIAQVEAKFQWTGNRGSSFVCSARGPLWGAPGSFL